MELLDLAAHGWEVSSGLDLTEIARSFADVGVAAFVVTEIARDGTLEGPSIEQLSAVIPAIRAYIWRLSRSFTTGIKARVYSDLYWGEDWASRNGRARATEATLIRRAMAGWSPSSFIISSMASFLVSWAAQ